MFISIKFNGYQLSNFLYLLEYFNLSFKFMLTSEMSGKAFQKSINIGLFNKTGYLVQEQKLVQYISKEKRRKM